MVDVTTSARPYARAAFAIAKEAKRLDEWQALLTQLALCVQNANMVPLMHNPQVSDEQLLTVCLACAPAGQDEGWANFVGLLLRNKRLRLVPAVAMLFERAKVEAAGVLPVVIESAQPLGDDYVKQLLTQLEKRFGHALCHETRLSPHLIGGVVVRVGNQVIDASLRGRLQSLRQQLIEAAITNE